MIAAGLTAAPQVATGSQPLGFGVLIPLFVVLALIAFAWAWWVRTVNLAYGFGVAIAMWAFTYLALLQPGFVISEALFALAVLSVAAGGYLAARRGGPGASGIAVGLVSAVVNSMIVGATLPRGGDQQNAMLEFGYILAGLLAGSALLGWIGFRIGAARNAREAAPQRTPLNPACVMAGFNALAIFFMIVLGGLVTSLEAGLAVPDWPNTMGHNMLLYPLSQMKGGVFYEHTHRLWGMLVGVCTLATLASVLKAARGGSLVTAALPKALAVLLVILVVGQGIVGGLRVTGNATTSLNPADLSPSSVMGVFHGVMGQVIFALAALLTLTLGPIWQSNTPPVSAPKTARTLPALALAALLLQIFLGVAMRQLQLPPTETAGPKLPSWAFHGHLTVGVIATVLIIMAGLKCAEVTQMPSLRRNGKAAVHTVMLQVCLGVGALIAVLIRRGEAIPWWEVTSTTAHQAVGALLLAVMALLWARSRRFVQPQSELALP